MKKFVALVLCLTLVLTCFTALLGCAEVKTGQLEEGKIYSLQEAYEINAISYNDLLSIACHSGNRSNNSIDENFSPKKIVAIDDAVSSNIKEAVAEEYRTRQYYSVPDAKADDVVLEYYGMYNAVYVFRHNDLYTNNGYTSDGDSDSITWIEGFSIEGLFFAGKQIYVWKEI